MSKLTVTVKYWRNTLQLTGKATTYNGAMRIASRNQNAYTPSFWHGNRRLYDTGYALAYEEELEKETIVCVL